MEIIYFGTPDFAVPSLEALIESGENIISVVTQPDKVKGRGHKLSVPPVKESALLRGIPVIQPSSIRTTEFFDEMAKLAPDIIVVVAYGKIIPNSLLNLPPYGCVNVHASLLPQYRGAAPIQWALINGEEKTGITTMLIDEGLDTGDVLMTEEVNIHEEDNAYTLGRRLSLVGASLLVKTLKGIENKTLKPVRQGGTVTYAPPLKKENGRINWALSASEISNLIRGTYPWPGAYCYLQDEKIHIMKAGVVNDSNTGAAGCINKISNVEIFVSTGKGMLAITEVKPEGKKVMTSSAFMHGRHLKEGVTFETL